MIFFKKLWRGKKALVLGGGSALGLAHVGVIKVLQEENITFDSIFGTSMGAIVGALYASGMNWQKMAELASDFTFLQLFKLRISRTGLIRSERLIEYLEQKLPVSTFEELSVPLFITSVDITNGREMVFHKGELPCRVASSCAIPGIITPVEIEGHMYVDGGMMNNVPVLIAKKHGYKRNLAVNVLNYYHGGEVGNIIDVVTRSVSLLAQKSSYSDVKNATLLLNPHLGSFGSMDYKKARWIILEGEESARRNIRKIRALFN